jgi:hypothetical protein
MHSTVGRFVEGIKSFVSGKSANGVLPTPYTGNGYVATVYNPNDATATGVALAQAVTSTGAPPNKINDDGAQQPTFASIRCCRGFPTPRRWK